MILSISLDLARNYVLAYECVIVLFSIVFILQTNKQSGLLNRQLAPLMCIILVAFITFRPEVWQYFGDTTNYARFFRFAQKYNKVSAQYEDPGFVASILLFRNFDLRVWFLFFAMLYVVPQYATCRRLFADYSCFAFVLLVGAFSFFGFGFNGMRNGAACAIVMWAFICPSFFIKTLLFIIAASLHKSVLLPIVAYVITVYYNKTKIYIYVWCICIFIAYFISNAFGDMQWLSDLLGDKRVNYLNQNFNSLENASKINFSTTGFRWDFLIYSAVPVYLGWVTIVNKRIKEEWYVRLFNIYLICNTAWLFTARVPFNNRFAYLSWFLLPLLLAYPFILNDSLKVNSKMNILVLFYLAFTLLSM